MKNGERSITFSTEYMEFKFSSMTISSVFYVKFNILFFTFEGNRWNERTYGYC